MQNFYDFIKAHPEELKQFSCKDLLFLMIECPPDFKKSEDWAQHNCFIHVLSGVNRMYTRNGSWHLEPGSTVFLKKGVIGLEKLVPIPTCALMFYVPDDYIRSFIKENSALIPTTAKTKDFKDQVIPIHDTPVLNAFYDSVATYFSSGTQLSEHLVELKFKELLLNIVTNEKNLSLTEYFFYLGHSRFDDLQDVMETNCFYNLHLEEYARLCHRSLSTYKRDFQVAFGIAPGKWLHEKRLERACHLLQHTEKTIADVVLESGFINITHFDRVFKKHFGIPPLKYRRQFSKPVEYHS
jgi:AraC family transcriptional regulator, exoenzyme S synthesis regulatory protein ExsA